MLIAREVEGTRCAQGPDRAITAALRPAVGVHVRRALVPLHVLTRRGHGHARDDAPRGRVLGDGRDVREGGLGEARLRTTGPIARCGSTRRASRAGSSPSSRAPSTSACVAASKPSAWAQPLRTSPSVTTTAAGTVHPVGEDREAPPTPLQDRVVRRDPSFERPGGVRRGEMRHLGAMHRVDELRRHHVAAAVLLRESLGVLTPTGVAPDVPVVDVVIVGDDDRGEPPRQLAERPAVAVLRQVVAERRRRGARANRGRPGPLVDLIAGEVEQVRLVVRRAARRRRAGTRGRSRST